MSRIDDLNTALKEGYQEFLSLKERGWKGMGTSFVTSEIYDLGESLRPEKPIADEGGVQLNLTSVMPPEKREHPAPRDRIAYGENLDYMLWLLREKNMEGKIQLIYVDPPFFSNAKYQASVQITTKDGSKSPVMKVGAYDDKWGHDFSAYLKMLVVRFCLMRELLSETGCFWVHLDWHGSHSVKLLLDEIFGDDHFINEVAWTYKSGGASSRSFAKKHDTLLFYSKTKAYKFNPQKEKSYNREGKPYRFKGVEEFEDKFGWYTMVNMKDVWNIDMVGRTSSERMGYATQKPEKLLERIVDACSDPGDLCADFFAGTGTLGAVCARKNRAYIMCDEGKVAISEQIMRLVGTKQAFAVEHPTAYEEWHPTTEAVIEVREGHVALKSYRPDMSLIRESDRELAFSYINKDSLDLISFWSLDADYDGKVHVGRQLLSGDDIGPLADRNQSLHVVGYDIFGGRFSWQGENEGSW